MIQASRTLKWMGLGAGAIVLSPLTSCLQAMQNEMEVVFAFNAVGNALLLPGTVIAQTLMGLLR